MKSSELIELLYRWKLCRGYCLYDNQGFADFAVELPRLPGLYALWTHKLELLYVGKANDIRQRILNHHIVEEAFSERFGGIAICHPATIMIDPIESVLINRLKPRLNRRNNSSMFLAEDIENLVIAELEKVKETRYEHREELEFNPPELTARQLKKELRKLNLSPLLKLKYFNEYKVDQTGQMMLSI